MLEQWEIDLLDEHLRHWWTDEQVEQIWHSSKPAFQVAAELACFDFAFFARFFMPDFFIDPPAQCHWDVFEDIEWAITEAEDATKLAESLPRGFGKSTIVCVALPLWVIIGQDPLSKRGKERTPSRHYIWIIKDSFDQAKLELASVKGELEHNEKLIAAYGRFQGPTWAKAEMVTSNRVRIEAIGTGQKVRGRRHGAHRPDLIIGDDLENDKTVRSPTMRLAVKEWWSAAVEKAGDPHTCLHLNLGTLLHYDCLQAYLLNRPGVRARKYKALLHEPHNQGLWDEWRTLVTNLDDADRERTARKFYKDHKHDMDAGAVVSWPERFPIYTLQLMRLGEIDVRGKKIRSFAPEMQNEPISDEDRLFKRFHYWHWEQEKGHIYLVPDGAGERVHLHDCRLIGACDPSLGESHNGSFSAIVDVLVSPMNRVFLAHGDLQRRHPDRIIDAIQARTEYWARLGMFYSFYGFETVQFQKLFASSAGQRLLAAGIRLPIVEVRSAANKNARIDSLQPDIENGYLVIMREPSSETPEELDLIWSQLWEYPMGDHNDGPDALEMARTIAVGGTGFATPQSVAVITEGRPPTAQYSGMIADPFR